MFSALRIVGAAGCWVGTGWVLRWGCQAAGWRAWNYLHRRGLIRLPERHRRPSSGRAMITAIRRNPFSPAELGQAGQGEADTTSQTVGQSSDSSPAFVGAKPQAPK